MEFTQYQAGALHEAGHAAMATLCGRNVQEISLLADEYGDGHVARERREGSQEEILEEILIALAGEEAPYLWGTWPTNAEHDNQRIDDLLSKAILPMTLDLQYVRSELKPVLERCRDAIGALAKAVLDQRQLSGTEVSEILGPLLPNDLALKDTVSAIIHVQSQLATVLQRFPNLLRSWRDTSSPALGNTFVGKLLTILRDDGVEIGLAAVDAALASLTQKFTSGELSEQIRDLFAEGGRSESRWEKSWTELTALAYNNDLNLLSSLGWPPMESDTPPFDCVLSISDQLIPCDIKTATGSGFSLVQSALSRVLETWALAIGTTDIPFALRYKGTLTQEIVGPTLNKAIRQFQSELAAMSEIPSSPLKLSFGDLRCEVFVGPASDAVSSGGIQGTDSLSDNFVQTYHSHVSQKAKTAKEQGGTPFLLMYVLTPGSGMSDLKTGSTFKDAIAKLHSRATTLEHDADSLWLGSVLLDLRQSSPRVVCCFRETSSWPEGVAPNQAAAKLKGELVML